MNTPNKLTIARMILVPFFVLFILTGWGGDANRYICLAIFVVASITDWFDGHLARKNNRCRERRCHRCKLLGQI